MKDGEFTRDAYKLHVDDDDLLPDAVMNAVAKLVPPGVILDAEATACGEFHLQVEGATKLKTVYVRRDQETTIAWTFDPTLECPRSGTYAFAEFRHNLDADSTIESTPRSVHARIEATLAATLPAKQFAVADADDAEPS